jgi:hypothetical protein
MRAPVGSTRCGKLIDGVRSPLALEALLAAAGVAGRAASAPELGDAAAAPSPTTATTCKHSRTGRHFVLSIDPDKAKQSSAR